MLNGSGWLSALNVQMSLNVKVLGLIRHGKPRQVVM